MERNQKIAYSFNRSAATYDEYADVQYRCASKLSALIPSLSGKKVLELGTGTGMLMQMILDKGALSVTGIDMCEDMLGVAQKKVAHENQSISFVKGILPGVLSELSCRYNTIISNATIQWIEEMDELAESAYGLLEAGGDLYFSYFPPTTYYELKEALRAVYGADIAIASDRFMPEINMMEIFQKKFSLVHQEYFAYQKRYPDLLTLLRDIKSTGVNARYNPTFRFTKEKIYKMQSYMERRWGSLSIHYKVGIFHFKKGK